MRVAESAVAAGGEHGALAALGEVGKKRGAVLFVDLRADRHLEHGVGAIGAMTILAHAGMAVLGEKVLLVAIVDQRIEPIDRLCDHVAALAAVAAIRPAILDEFFTPERYAAVAAVAGADIDLGLVEEFHLGVPVTMSERQIHRMRGANWRSAARRT